MTHTSPTTEDFARAQYERLNDLRCALDSVRSQRGLSPGWRRILSEGWTEEIDKILEEIGELGDA